MAKKKDTKKDETINPADRPDARLIYSGDTPKHKAPAGVLLRLPRSLHLKLKAQAYEEGVPMAQHILRCLAEASKAVEMGHQIGVIHVSSKTDTSEVDLEKLLKDRPIQLVVLGFHYILRELMRYVSMVAPVIHQDVSHWVCDLGWKDHLGPSARDLFGE